MSKVRGMEKRQIGEQPCRRELPIDRWFKPSARNVFKRMKNVKFVMIVN